VARAGLSRERVVEEAERLAAAEGWAQLTWSSLASSLGVRPPSLYNHWSSFDALKTELAVRGMTGLRDALSAAARGRTGTDALKDICRAYVTFGRRHPALYQASLRAPAEDEQPFASLARETLDIVFGVLEPYRFSRENAVHAVRIVRASLHGLMAIDLAGGFRMAESLDSTLEVLLTTLVVGFQSFADTEVS
jgi:AcrR family transcriptional regulator